jgi:ABC-type transporter Mla subunit MlaD
VDKVKQLGADAAGHARDIFEDAKSRGGDLLADAQTGVTSAIEDHKGGLADQLEDVADAVHRSGEQLEGHQDWIATLVERGADELKSLADTVRDNDLKGLMSNLQDLARRQPAVFIGASMAAGFAMVRLGKVAASGLSKEDLPSLPEVHFDRQ